MKTRSLLGLAFAAAVALLVACGGGGQVASNVPASPEAGGTAVQIRTLSSEFTSRKAVSYAPYRTANRDTEVVLPSNVKQDLTLLAAGGFKLIRLFDSSDAMAKVVLQVIKDNNLDIKVMLGAWIASGNDTFNQAEIQRTIALANAYSDIVLAVSVGNETLVSWSYNPVSPSTLVSYIKAVRNAIRQPVTTDDNWAFFAKASSERNDPKLVLDTIDFVAMHTYPLADSVHNSTLWDWKQEAVAASARATAMMDAAIAAARKDHDAVRTYLDGNGYKAMPIVIGETGWKAVASNGEFYRAHPVNQKMYFDRLSTWADAGRTGTGPKAIFYFEAFDEPWKGTDDKWGLFNVNRQARYVVQSLYPSSQAEPGTYTTTDAVYYVAANGGGTVTANRYTVYADAVTAGEARPTVSVAAYGWDSPATAFAGEGTTTESTGDVASTNHFYEVGPAPTSWGWGLILNLPSATADLSNFATGRLNFSIKTTYPGKLEFGFFTGSTLDGTGYDVYLAVDPANNSYGYKNDGTWRQVSIPIIDLVAKGAKASCCQGSSASMLDLTKVASPFVIADRYSVTGKATNYNDKTKISIDAVYWSR